MKMKKQSLHAHSSNFFFKCFLSAIGWICRYSWTGTDYAYGLWMYNSKPNVHKFPFSLIVSSRMKRWHSAQNLNYGINHFKHKTNMCKEKGGYLRSFLIRHLTESIEGKRGSMLIIKLEQFTFLITWRGQTGHILTEYLSSPQCLFFPLFA